MSVSSWFRRGRHHVARVGARSCPECRGYAVVERIKSEPDSRDGTRTAEGWTLRVVDGREFLERDVMVTFAGFDPDVPTYFVMEPPPSLVNIPALGPFPMFKGPSDPVADQLRRDVPVAEIVEPWHGHAGIGRNTVS